LDTSPSRAGAALRKAQNGIAPRSGSPWTDTPDHDSGSGADEYDEDELDEREWGLEKGMELFEVSAKDDTGMSVCLSVSSSGILNAKCAVGITQLFDALILAIIAKKDIIEQENESKRHDSVILTSTPTPTWAAQADEEEAREKEAARSHAARSCCQA
jgi:hypothetical protein